MERRLEHGTDTRELNPAPDRLPPGLDQAITVLRTAFPFLSNESIANILGLPAPTEIPQKVLAQRTEMDK